MISGIFSRNADYDRWSVFDVKVREGLFLVCLFLKLPKLATRLGVTHTVETLLTLFELEEGSSRFEIFT